jgi:hypothetical protein
MKPFETEWKEIISTVLPAAASDGSELAAIALTTLRKLMKLRSSV